MDKQPPLYRNVNEELALEVKKAFVTQFAENQNHHQALFIKFLSVVIVALIAYVYVYTNTAGYRDPSKLINTTATKDSLIQPPLTADVLETTKGIDGHIISYSQVQLVGTYLFAQLVLVVLGLTVLHLGYSYRRDQQVVYSIRVESLGETQFKKIFPTGFTGLGKRYANYLPNFYGILFVAILLMQAITYCSIFMYLNGFPDVKVGVGNIQETIVFIETSFGFNITYRDIKFLLGFPIGLLVFFHFWMYVKYNTKVNNIKLINQLTITAIARRNSLLKIAILCGIFGVIKTVILTFAGQNSISLLSSIYLSCAAFLTNIFIYYISAKGERMLAKHISNAIVFTFAAYFILSTTIRKIANDTYHVDQKPYLLFISVLVMSILLYWIARIFHKKQLAVKDNSTPVAQLISLESYFLIILALGYASVIYSKITYLDYLVSFIIGIVAARWAIRSYVYIIDGRYGRTSSQIQEP